MRRKIVWGILFFWGGGIQFFSSNLIASTNDDGILPKKKIKSLFKKGFIYLYYHFRQNNI